MCPTSSKKVEKKNINHTEQKQNKTGFVNANQSDGRNCFRDGISSRRGNWPRFLQRLKEHISAFTQCPLIRGGAGEGQPHSKIFAFPAPPLPLHTHTVQNVNQDVEQRKRSQMSRRKSFGNTLLSLLYCRQYSIYICMKLKSNTLIPTLSKSEHAYNGHRIMQGNVGCGACDPRQSRLHVWNSDATDSGWGTDNLGLRCLHQALLSTLATGSLHCSPVSIRIDAQRLHCTAGVVR